MALPITISHQRPGGTPVELTGRITGVKLSSAAVGGFGSAEFSIPGDARRLFGYLGMVRFYYGSTLLWEGQLEDRGIAFNAATQTTSVRAFGLRRKFDETSVRRIWSKRDWSYVIRNPDPAFQVLSGLFDSGDLTKSGIASIGSGGTSNLSVTNWGDIILPSGLTVMRVMFTLEKAGSTQMRANVQSSSDGVAFTAHANISAAGTTSQDLVLVANARVVRMDFPTDSNFATAASDFAKIYDVRVLGTTLTEDAPGGFYGGTILRDLVALCPELTIGIIEDGSDYTIQAIERALRDTVASAVNEVAGYYTREWAVWEDGRFDWRARNLDEVQWIAGLDDVTALELDASTDDLARTVYVLYTDAASGLDAEATAVATDQRNPYVRQAKTKDMLVTPGFPMTANTSAQLASVVAADAGARPSVGGSCVIPADKMIENGRGPKRPAALLRGGENIVFPELPKTDVLLQGRDGETLFHIASVELDVDANKITLTLEGQQRRTDVILARLAAATRVLTG